MTNEDKQLALLQIVEAQLDKAIEATEAMNDALNGIPTLGETTAALGNAFLELVPKMDRLQSLVNKGC